MKYLTHLLFQLWTGNIKLQSINTPKIIIKPTPDPCYSQCKRKRRSKEGGSAGERVEDGSAGSQPPLHLSPWGCPSHRIPSSGLSYFFVSLLPKLPRHSLCSPFCPSPMPSLPPHSSPLWGNLGKIIKDPFSHSALVLYGLCLELSVAYQPFLLLF